MLGEAKDISVGVRSGVMSDLYGWPMSNSGCALRLVDDILVHLAPGMYSFCKLLTFAFEGQPSAYELLIEVMAHPRYRDDCASPWTGPCGDVHGPYRLQALTVEGFQPCSAATAISTLTEWPATNLNPWVSASLLLSREIVAAWVSPLVVEAAELYRLSVTREGNEHEYGWVVGLAGFHEFIAIDRHNAAVTVIVATDD